ncbi:hypothetical protein MmiEs2_14100 [Methanimicrococcus stummii]|uniref:SbsA Ig-like domain-containing protein n=1 Tax=Methanimicrococcus stummii TaxID=3028294 RepID=A0AA96V9F3_9EURY|nr:Ig-like domain-containing protein [Methanimicrococcus sp. Es2]WNY29187.1 hypothetical protein MmiEs2_14100 [Methanimicrococcus sp. Es2]
MNLTILSPTSFLKNDLNEEKTSSHPEKKTLEKRKRTGLRFKGGRILALILIVLLLFSAIMPPISVAALPDISDGYGERWDGIDFESMIGDGIYYGTYDHAIQMNYHSTSNLPDSRKEGTETPILWKIMGEEANDGYLTLFSEYVLDARPFNTLQDYPGSADYFNNRQQNIRPWLGDYSGFLASFGSSGSAEDDGLATFSLRVRMFERNSGVEYATIGGSYSSFPIDWKGYFMAYCWYVDTYGYPVSTSVKAYIPWGLRGGSDNTVIAGFSSPAYPDNNTYPDAGYLFWDAGNDRNVDYLIGKPESGDYVGTLKNGNSADYWTRSPNAEIRTTNMASGFYFYPYVVDSDNSGSVGTWYFANQSAGIRPLVKLNPENVIFAHEIVSGTPTHASQVQEDWVSSGIWNYSESATATNYKLTILDDSLELKELYDGSRSLSSGGALAPIAGTLTLTSDSSTGFTGDYLSYKIVADDGTDRTLVAYGTNKNEVDKETLEIEAVNSLTDGSAFDFNSYFYTLYVWTEVDQSIRSFEGSDVWYFDFIEAGAPANSGPSVIDASPNGTGVLITENTAFITFDTEMNASPGFPGTVTLDNGAVLTGGTWSSDNKTISYSLSDLAYSTTYKFTIKDFEDIFDETMTDSIGDFEFTTVPDTTKPTVISVIPNGTGIAVTTNSLSVTFSEAMNTSAGFPGTVTLDNGATVSGAGTWSNGGKTVTYTLSGLAYSTTYLYTIQNFEDLAGNTMDPSTNDFHFTTVPDTTKPTVISVNPDGSGIAITTNSLSITFSEAMNTSTGYTKFVTLDNGATVNGVGTWSLDGKTVTYDLSGLTYSTTYNYTITGFKDLAGNTMNPSINAFDFTTVPDTTNPTIISVDPHGTGIAVTKDSLSVTFSEAMNTSAVFPGTVSLDNGAVLSVSGTWSLDKKTITYGLSNLAYSTTYSYTITDFEDLAGNAIAPSLGVYTFTTVPDTDKPIVVRVSPNGTGIAISTDTLTVTFNESMDTSAGFPGTVSLDNGANLANGAWINDTTIAYDLSDLTYSTTYLYTIEDFEDLAGNVMNPSVGVFSFRTVSPGGGGGGSSGGTTVITNSEPEPETMTPEIPPEMPPEDSGGSNEPEEGYENGAMGQAIIVLLFMVAVAVFCYRKSVEELDAADEQYSGYYGYRFEN